MNNRNREHEHRERSQGNRYSTSGYGSDEGDYGPAPHGASRQDELQGASGASASQWRGDRDRSDRDVQGSYGDWRQDRASWQGQSREGGRATSQSPADFSRRGDDGRGQYGPSQSSQSRQWREPGAQRYGAQGSPYGSQGYGAASERFESQDYAQDYSQGRSHYGSQGFGAQGSQGVYGPQGFGAQGARSSSDYERQSGYGGYNREGYGASQELAGGRQSQWREGGASQHGSAQQSGAYDRDMQGMGGASGSRYGSTGYRGMGPRNYTRSDERIREDLNEKLTDSDEIDASGISVEVSNGVATLSGTVAQRWMKHRAEDLAESCGGVRDVNNQIRVTSPAGSRTKLADSSASGSPPSASGTIGSAGSGMGASGSTGAATASGVGAKTTTGSNAGSPANRSGGSSTTHN